MKSRKSTFLACCYFFLQKIQTTLIADKILVCQLPLVLTKSNLMEEGFILARSSRGYSLPWRGRHGAADSTEDVRQGLLAPYLGGAGSKEWTGSGGWVIKPKSRPGDLLKGSQSSRTMPPAGDEISKCWAFRRMFHIPITTGDSIWFTLKRILLLL